jgi:protein-L-isoaspartate O-methyltransferase
MEHTATYSPEDNKLRLYPAFKLDQSDYERVKAAGFKWAPKQGLFVAPMWTPAREDLLIEMCGEVGDEDTSLVDRAEQRADRFEDYSENRAKDAESAHKAVSAIADNIPLGQPILVGHHSEKHARKDAQRIENGMRRAVKMWEQAEYWKQRAAGALSAAKYKERADVRARRIKGLEADKRKAEKEMEQSTKFIKLWRQLDDAEKWKTKGGGILSIIERAKYIANYDHVSMCFSLSKYPAAEGVHAYEGMQSLWSALDGGRITAEQARDIAIPIHERGNVWRLRWLDHYVNRIAYERAMLQESGGLESDKVAPEIGGAVRSLWGPRGGWAYIFKVNRITVTIRHQWNDGGRVFNHNEPMDKIREVMSKAQVDEARESGRLVESENGAGFWLAETPKDTEPPKEQTQKQETMPAIEAMREQLKQGVQVVSAPQLFPTPPKLAARLVELADIGRGMTVLEPSAGTGNIMQAIMNDDKAGAVVAVEINQRLADRLREEYALSTVHCCDFLQFSRGNWPVDRIVMNPPFANGDDIKHIKHAASMLKPGGRLVAICAGGPRQREALSCLGTWEDLPLDSFKSSGTSVNAAIVVIQS